MLENLLPMIAMADDVVTVFQTVAGNVLSLARGIVLPIGIIGVIVCGVKLMVATDPQSVASTKRWLMFIVIGIIIVMFAPAILEQLKSLAQTGGFTW